MTGKYGWYTFGVEPLKFAWIFTILINWRCFFTGESSTMTIAGMIGAVAYGLMVRMNQIEAKVDAQVDSQVDAKPLHTSALLDHSRN